ncbi:hypothetical protein BH20ACI2_BH20ACI2_20070 [soil metagenome]
MCYYLYLASDADLPLVEWQENDRAYNVAELEHYDVEVKKRFSKSHIVFLGAHTGCSCGFLYDSAPYDDKRDEIEDEAARESIQKLVEYLSAQAKNSSLELFACWNGDQGEEPSTTLNIAPSYFIGTEFPLGEEPTLLRVDKI